MVFFLSATFLLLVYLFPAFLARLRRDQGRGGAPDLFGPVNFLAFFGVLGVPYLYILAFDRDSLIPDVQATPWITDLDRDVVLYVLLSAAIFVATLLGVKSRLAGAVARHLPRLGAERFTPARCSRGLLVALGLALALWGYYLHSIGGLRNLWVNMALRTLIGAGKGYVTMGYQLLLYFGAVLLLYRLRFDHGWRRRAGVALGLLAISAVLVSGGGRTPLLELIVICFLAHHYGVRRRKRLLTPGSALVGVMMLAFILVIPLFRSSGRFDRYSQRPDQLLRDSFRSLSAVAPQFSAFDRTSIMLEYFTLDRLWAGRSWIDLLMAPLPRSIYRQKPPVDDGIYMKEIVDGHQVVPPTPGNRMTPTSWPMGNLVLYMNFGLPGLILGCWLTGVAMGAAYQYLKDTGYSPVAILFYELFARLGLTFSVWGLVQLAMMLVLAGLFFWGMFRRRHWPRLAPAAPAGSATPAW